MSVVYDKQALLDAADSLTVADFVGLETKRVGSKISILCPSHADAHFGNCFLSERGYHCFACGAHGDVFSLVRAKEGCNFQEAMGIVGDSLGGRELFILKGKDAAKPKLKPIPKRDDLELIGLKNNTEWDCIAIVPANELEEYLEKNPLKATQRLKFDPGDPEVEDGWYFIEEKIDSHPLLTLMQNDEELCKEMIKNKAEETSRFYAELSKCIKPSSALREAALTLSSRAEEIAIEYGGKAQKKNMFGKLRRRA